MSLNPDEEMHLMEVLEAAFAEAKDAGATTGQMVCAFIAAMASVSDAELRVNVLYPKPKKQSAKKKSAHTKGAAR